MTQGALYSTIVKIRADEAKIDDKLHRIAWVGKGEQKDDIAARKFDHQASKEVIEPSEDEELMAGFEKTAVTLHRHPKGQARGVIARERIIKIDLPNKDRLLAHMRSGRQSLPELCRFVRPPKLHERRTAAV
ncbi:hypothetical protein GCK32_016601 [Trichostrongylus colubriformis]|uniref:Uncharacterized protein n=1 Tax=Trichostrongylus colubriformis TaxID=6319 RepID=A0AAN8FDP5_TRICO